MIFHHIALNIPLGLMSYHHDTALAAGTRVAVRFRGKLAAGIVWAANIAPDIDPAKILLVETVFDSEQRLPESWLELVGFAARYYHYPIGQTAFTALPQGLKETQAQTMPEPPLRYTLNAAGRQAEPPPKRSPKQRELWNALCSGSPDKAALKAIHGGAAALLEQWQAQGWIDTQTAAAPHFAPSAHILNSEQTAAAAQIHAAAGSFAPFLLYGITGSGKTEVYFEAMAQALASGRQVLFLLPEINLTPQLLKRVAARFADVPTAVLHSQTAAGRRSRDYLRAMLGQAKLIIGTRLAVFTPLPDLGLIIVDEEHDSSFKQDSELRYQARDLAVWRAQQSGCPIVLGSATPSLESWHKAQNGRYRLLTLSGRAHAAAKLPEIEILDVRRIKLEDGFSPQALQLLRDNRERGGISLVYLNRRGFAPALFCSSCGHLFGCPNCSAKLVLHRRQGRLHCHHCDFRQPVPVQCPDCGNQDLSAVGHGTQRVEETLRMAMPEAKIVRVDRDSTSRKSDWDDLYRLINNGGADILVGTQMLAKGHDFARLNLVLVLNADGSLYSADFRAPERLFAELMQVSGRAGRADMAGRVLIQTQLPEHPVFAAVKAQDYAAFAEQELAGREMFALPPFGFQAAVRADAAEVADAADFLQRLKLEIAAKLPETGGNAAVAQLGPAPMLMVRLAERERAQLFLESGSRQALHRAVSLWQQALSAQRCRDIRWSLDIDPADM